MTSYLVEAYMPTTTNFDELESRAARAADDLSVAGHAVRYLRSIYVVEDEICFHMFDADSADIVQLASDRADLRAQRIVPAVAHEPP